MYLLIEYKNTPWSLWEINDKGITQLSEAYYSIGFSFNTNDTKIEIPWDNFIEINWHHDVSEIKKYSILTEEEAFLYLI